ncbi:tetratricopeptide repeat protein [Hyalangium versicolor]|uniref:tetratricopeptide repeat protein n=1 Tax=Hyalangium versicolor TaxID=2861190 RepID=UPI001CCF4A83|nr:hypothetical protein [Hyalangium versicolor]
MSQRIENHEEPFDLLSPLDESAGPAPRISPQRSAALIQGVLTALEAPPAPPSPRRWYLRRGTWLSGAALVLAGAATVSFLQSRTAPPAPQPVQEIVQAPVPMPPTPPAVEPAPEPVEPPAAASPPEPAVIPSQEPVVKPRPAAPASEPEDLLRLANERRAAGKWRDAESLYLRIIQSHPGSGSAYVARVASGELRLQHLQDAQGALRQFQQALRMQPQGALSEEARHGVAEAWRVIGDAAHEAEALKDFLKAHPDSLHAEAAERRLKELAAPAP